MGGGNRPKKGGNRSVASCGYDFEAAYQDARTCAA